MSSSLTLVVPPEHWLSFARLDDADAGEIFTMQRAAFIAEAQAHHDLFLPPLTQSLTELREDLRQSETQWWGLRTDNRRLVAAVKAQIHLDDTSVAHVGRFMVTPDLQGQGLGSYLWQLVEPSLPGSVRRIELFTGEYSHANLRLYARWGFAEVDRQPTPAGYVLIHLSKQRSMTV